VKYTYFPNVSFPVLHSIHTEFGICTKEGESSRKIENMAY